MDIGENASNVNVVLMLMEPCHRHNATTTIAARLGTARPDFATLSVAVLDSTSHDLPEMLRLASREHAAFQHGSHHCDRRTAPSKRPAVAVSATSKPGRATPPAETRQGHR